MNSTGSGVAIEAGDLKSGSAGGESTYGVVVASSGTAAVLNSDKTSSAGIDFSKEMTAPASD